MTGGRRTLRRGLQSSEGVRPAGGDFLLVQDLLPFLQGRIGMVGDDPVHPVAEQVPYFLGDLNRPHQNHCPPAQAEFLCGQPTTRDWNSRTGIDIVALDESGSVPDWPNACHDTAQPAVAVIV